MTTSKPDHLPTEPSDPYALDPEDIADPPRTFGGRLRFLGPG